ncbi:MAG: NAD-dependent epimerase/dehydratase family protein [Minisyncoccia bacterium]
MNQRYHTILVTGAAGYVGAMLVNELSKREDVSRIIGVDKDPAPDFIAANPKLVFIEANTSDAGWEEKVASYEPDVVIHTAWQIRCFYGNPKLEWKWNVEGTRRVFRFAFSTPSVTRLVHFSTASIYGAYATNTFTHRFREDEPLREKEYLYGIEKGQSEKDLEQIYAQFGQKQKKVPQVSIVRPAAITGPRGRSMHHRFGLQSALSGTLKGSFIYRIVRLLVSFVPATDGWCRQFVHEDDVVDIVTTLALESYDGAYEIFNLTPPGAPVMPEDMARAVGKKTVHVSPRIIRFAYFFFWHITRGKIPTAPGSWRFYSYPIVMEGSKVTKLLGHEYKMESKDAFVKNEGRYATLPS